MCMAVGFLKPEVMPCFSGALSGLVWQDLLNCLAPEFEATESVLLNKSTSSLLSKGLF